MLPTKASMMVVATAKVINCGAPFKIWPEHLYINDYQRRLKSMSKIGTAPICVQTSLKKVKTIHL